MNRVSLASVSLTSRHRLPAGVAPAAGPAGDRKDTKTLLGWSKARPWAVSWSPPMRRWLALNGGRGCSTRTKVHTTPLKPTRPLRNRVLAGQVSPPDRRRAADGGHVHKVDSTSTVVRCRSCCSGQQRAAKEGKGGARAAYAISGPQQLEQNKLVPCHAACVEAIGGIT